MKNKLIPFLSSLVLAVTAYGHGEIKIGPNGGRIVEFGKDSNVVGEVSEKEGKFQIRLLDKQMKPVALADQELTVTSGEREKPVKLPVEKKDAKFFVAPTAKSGQWVILQFKETAAAKPATARFQYDAALSKDGKTPNWLHAH